MTSRKHLVYFNDSLGELDWLAPYIIKRADETSDEFHLYFKFKTLADENSKIGSFNIRQFAWPLTL